MMGEQAKSEGLFYYFKLEDHVPRTHLLRLIDRHVDFGFLRNRLRPLYSETGRPSVDPELMIRMLPIGYLYGITSERRLCEDVGMHSVLTTDTPPKAPNQAAAPTRGSCLGLKFDALNAPCEPECRLGG